jgi:hypothetical protein
VVIRLWHSNRKGVVYEISAETLLSKNKLGKTQARAKGIMKLTKDKLLSAIAELVENLKEFGCDNNSLIHMLKNYGFTKEQLKEWYGIGE